MREGKEHSRKVEVEDHDGNILVIHSQGPELVLHGIDDPSSMLPSLALGNLKVGLQRRHHLVPRGGHVTAEKGRVLVQHLPDDLVKYNVGRRIFGIDLV
jgi:hypothetical protein